MGSAAALKYFLSFHALFWVLIFATSYMNKAIKTAVGLKAQIITLFLISMICI